MDEKIQSLLTKLDVEEIEPWLEEMTLGKPVYDEILKAIDDSASSPRQIRNGLFVLFRLRLHGDQDALFNKLLEFAASDNHSVRSQAIKLAIGMIRLSGLPGHHILHVDDWHPVVEAIRRAVEAGIEGPGREIVFEFLDRWPG